MIVASQCGLCKHFNRAVTSKNVCKAFPSGIPDSVWLNRALHTVSIEGDNGTTFEARSSRLTST